jgi:hypothetical protein
MELLQKLFGEYEDCTFREIASPRSNEIAQILSKDGIVSCFETGMNDIYESILKSPQFVFQTLAHQQCSCSLFYLMEVRMEKFTLTKEIISPFTTCGMPSLTINFWKIASKSTSLG